jgi:hypothetical protein
MSESIYNDFIKNSQSFECFNKKQELKEALYSIFKDIIPCKSIILKTHVQVFNFFCLDVGVYIVGSSSNGFGTNKSDVDMCLMVSHEEVILFKMYTGYEEIYF